ncbi:MAG TPA: type VI secretion system tube protein Hcp [Verrucomicrobiae bacterium]|nr:type VI secretion system tube protein Hcp [Verrucomicrobiae bacterium]
MKRSLLLALLVPVVLASPVHAAHDMFLKLDGIKGESKDNRHRDEIEVLSFSWGMTNTPVMGGGGATGKVSFHDISVVARLSKASPQLLAACAGGTNIVSATLYVRDSATSTNDYYQIKLENMQISSLKQSSVTTAASSDDRPTEEVAFYFSKITATYTEEDGTVTTGTAVKSP